MDPLLNLLPAGGVFTVLAVVIVYLLRTNHQDRKQFSENVAAMDARHKEESKAREERHVAELAAFGQKVANLEASNERVLAALEAERSRRWAAEDSAEQFKRLSEQYLLLAEKGKAP